MVLTRDEGSSLQNKEEVRSKVDQAILHFVDIAKEMETFFLQKRLLLSGLKPELIVREETNELKLELVRKEDLIRKQYEKLSIWQNMLADLHGNAGGSGAVGSSSTLSGMKQSASQLATAPGTPQSAQTPNPIGTQQGPISQQMPQPTTPGQQPLQGMVGPQITPSMPGMPHPQGMVQSQSVMQPGIPGPTMSQGMSNFGPQAHIGQGGPQRMPFPGMNQGQMGPSGLQGPLAYLEKTTSNIGMQDSRR